MSRYLIDGARSIAVVQARSSIGPVVFEAVGLEGDVEVTIADGTVDLSQPITATIRIPMQAMRSGNDLFDSELARRIDARVHPWTTLVLDRVEDQPGGTYQLAGTVEFHSVRRHVSGAVSIEHADDRRLAVSGEKTLDIRDFQVPAPTMLMLKIYPEVRVALVAEAVRSDPEDRQPGVR